MTQTGHFITIEGVEGAGKSTSLTFLRQQFDQAGIDYMVTREPGGTPLAEDIRAALLNPNGEAMSAYSELFLMFAARVQNIEQVIKPALDKGQWVISDRFTDASFAYQGGGRGLDWAQIQTLADWVQGDLQPDMTLLLDVPIDIGLARMRERGAADRIESEGEAFFERVRQGYLTLAALNPKRYRIIHAEQSIAAVQQQILTAITPLLQLSTSQAS